MCKTCDFCRPTCIPPNYEYLFKKFVNAENDEMQTVRMQGKQIIGVFVLAEVSRIVTEIGREHGFSDIRFCKLHFKYGGTDASEAKRMPMWNAHQ